MSLSRVRTHVERRASHRVCTTMRRTVFVLAHSPRRVHFDCAFDCVPAVVGKTATMKAPQCVAPSDELCCLATHFAMDSNDVVRKIIGLYESNRLLWDPKHDDYYNKVQREYVWRKMSSEMNIPRTELKRKVNSLLGSYRREKSRAKKRNLTVSGINEIHKPKWFAYDWFAFLSKKSVRRYRTDIMADDTEKIVEESTDDNNGYSSNSESAYKDVTDIPLPTPQVVTGESVSQNVTEAPPITIKTQKRCAVKSNKALLKDAHTILKSTQSTTSAGVTDHYDSFGNHVASELRKYDEQLVPHVKKAILEILFQADIGNFFDRSEPAPVLMFCHGCLKSRRGSQHAV